MNYNNKKFRPISNSENSKITPKTIFLYKQEGNILTSSYTGDNILKGHLIGIVDQNGVINIRYHQINTNGELMTGICISKPKINSAGKIILYENWKWTSGDNSEGTTILEEI